MLCGISDPGELQPIHHSLHVDVAVTKMPKSHKNALVTQHLNHNKKELYKTISIMTVCYGPRTNPPPIVHMRTAQ